MSRAQSSGQSSISARTPRPDASTLGVTAFNVGLIQADAFIKTQDAKAAQLASHVKSWLQEGQAVVGLNEIHPDIVTKLQRKLEGLGVYVDFAIDDSNCLLWRTPQWSTYLVLACLPCLPALPCAGAACPAFLPCLPALPGALE